MSVKAESDLLNVTIPQKTRIHPLLLDDILPKVFQALSLQQLLLCRLVCKTWVDNSELKKLIASKSAVSLRTIFLHTSATSKNLEEYFVGGPIYSNYVFEGISYNNAFISTFFNVIGSSIQSLKLLLRSEHMNSTQFRDLIYNRLPNLKELHIYSLSHEDVYAKSLFSEKDEADFQLQHDSLVKLVFQEVRLPIIPFLTEFLGTAPNLREIFLMTQICCDWEEQGNLWRDNSPLATSVIQSLDISGTFKALKVLRCGKLRDNLMKSLTCMGQNGLQLEVLQLHVPTKEQEAVFYELLKSLENSLCQLIMFEQRRPKKGAWQVDSFVLNLPETMFKLELLQLSMYHKADIVSLLPLNFATQCPKLKRLVFLGRSSEGDISVNGKNSIVSNIVLWSRVRKASTAYDLGSFSKLTKLHVRYPHPDFLGALWPACDKLQCLELIFEEEPYMDESMTGIAECQIAKWISQFSLSNVFTQLSGTCTFTEESQNRHTSILKMKDLKTLKIIVEQNEESERQALCDITACFGLANLQQLKHLELYTSNWQLGLTECSFFSEECKQHIRRELDATVIHFAPIQQGLGKCSSFG